MDASSSRQIEQTDSVDGQSMSRTEPLLSWEGNEWWSGEEDHPVAVELQESLLPKDATSPEQFLPHSELKRILSAGNIRRLLAEVVTSNRRLLQNIDVEREILPVADDSKRIKILAVLILMEKPAHIVRFIKENVCDSALPLPDSHDFFKSWSKNARFIKRFCEWQWAVLAPVIDFTVMKHRVIHPQARMPFLDRLLWAESREGAHGEVLRVSVHEHYQERRYSSTQDSYPFYAIKRFKFNENDDTFEKERDALARFSGEGKTHPNLIELFFSYQRGPSKYLIFPWAKWDLQRFWKNEKRDPPSSKNFIWLLRQCYGLADGLCQVHVHSQDKNGTDKDDTDTDNEGDTKYGTDKKLEGRHGDIKPQNILFLEASQKAPDRFVLADFTLMRFHAPNADVTDANMVGFSRTYRPPEVEGKDGIGATHKYDIWTLGCVYLEFVTWHLLGYEAIYEQSFRMADTDYESFSTARQSDDDKRDAGSVEDKFFNLNSKDGAIVKNSVRQWIAFLKSHRHASPGLRAFLDLVLDRMLVTHPKNRRDTKKLLVQFDAILSKCNSCVEYSLPGYQDPEEVISVTDFPRLFTDDSKYGKVDDTPLRDDHHTLNTKSRSDMNLFKAKLLPSRSEPRPSVPPFRETPPGTGGEDRNPSGLGLKPWAEVSSTSIRITGPGRSSVSLQTHLVQADSRLDTISRQQSGLIEALDSNTPVMPRASRDQELQQHSADLEDEISKQHGDVDEGKRPPKIRPKTNRQAIGRRCKRLLLSARKRLEAWKEKFGEVYKRLR